LPVTEQTAAIAELRSPPSDFPAPQIAVLFFALLLLTTIPVWTHPLPPLADYVNHLARMHVIATIDRDVNLSRYYEIDWQIIPNLMMDLVVPVVARATNVYLAGQIFTVACFFSIASGVLLLNRSLFGRWSPVPLIALPLLYNYVFLVGVMNYMFGIGLVLWALGAWILLRERAWPWRLGVSVLFAFALFFCHLFALGLYGLGLLASETWRLWCQRQEPVRRRLINFLACGMPFLFVLPLLLASPTLQLAGDMSWEPRGKLDGLIYVIEAYADIVALALSAVLAAACAWMVRHRLLQVHPFAWVLMGMSIVVYLLMPRVFFATYMADQRMPVAIAFMIIASIDAVLLRREVRRGFIAILLVLLALRIIEVDVAWARQSATTREFRQSVRRVKPGAKVLVAYSGQSSGDDVRDFSLVHAACLAMIERSALVTTAFTVRGKQILHTRPEYEHIVDNEDGTPPSIGQLVIAGNEAPDEDETEYWRQWPSRFDYLYVLFTDDDAPNPDSEVLTLLFEGDRFQLYSINKPK
jgi:hypothetical protein